MSHLEGDAQWVRELSNDQQTDVVCQQVDAEQTGGMPVRAGVCLLGVWAARKRLRTPKQTRRERIHTNAGAVTAPVNTRTSLGVART